MEDIWIDYVLVFLLGWTIGVKFYMYRLEKDLKKFAKTNGIDLEEVVSKPSAIPLLTVEVQEGVLYLYDKKTKIFVCQGQTLDEVANLLEQYKKIPQARVEYLNRTLLIDKGKVYYEG
jgi:hypothetical protein